MEYDNGVFTEKNLGKLLFKFSLPATISFLVAQLYNLIDTFFVGNSVGVNGLGALTIAYPIQSMYIAIGMLVSVGGATLLSRSYGEQDEKMTIKSITNSLTLIIILNIILTVLIFLFMEPLLKFIGASVVVMPYAKTYVSVIAAGSIFLCLSLAIPQFITALGDAKASLRCTLIGAITNTILDYIFVVIFNYGVLGAAIATIIAQMFSTIYAIRCFIKISGHIKLDFKSLSIDKFVYYTITTIGFSAFMIDFSESVTSLVLNKVLSNSGGDVALVVAGIVMKINLFMYIPIIGVSAGMQPIAAYNYGADNYKNLKEVTYKALKSLIITSFIFWVIMLSFSRQVVSLFIKDPLVIIETAKAFKICMAFYPTIGVYFIAIYYFQAIGNARTSFFLAIFKQIMIFIPMLFVLKDFLGFGITGVWLTFPISDIIASILSIIYIKYSLDKIGIPVLT